MWNCGIVELGIYIVKFALYHFNNLIRSIKFHNVNSTIPQFHNFTILVILGRPRRWSGFEV